MTQQKQADVEITVGVVVEFVEGGGLRRLKRSNTADGAARIRVARLLRALANEHKIYSEAINTVIVEHADTNQDGQPSISPRNQVGMAAYKQAFAEMADEPVVLDGRCTLSEAQIESIRGIDIGDTGLLLAWFVDGATSTSSAIGDGGDSGKDAPAVEDVGKDANGPRGSE